MDLKFSYEMNASYNTEDVMGIVVHALPLRDVSSGSNIKDLIIVNAESRPMILTLWNDFAKEEDQQLASTRPTSKVVVAMRVRVTTFNLLSVTTTNATTIMINPPMAEAVTLKQWYIDHKEEVNHQLELKVYQDPEFLLPPPNESEIISVNSALNNLQTTSYWFTTCQNCKKGLRAQVGWIVKCTQCKAKGQVEPRCRFTLGIEDNTGHIQAVISGLEAEQLLPMTATHVSLKKSQDRDESNYVVVVVYVNEDNIEPIMLVEETNTYVDPHILGKQPTAEKSEDKLEDRLESRLAMLE
ncbi:replication protein A 70 kDa DNA-binding subunit A [Striga asiatica]|uniref:Replication protein A 70 kDa DNA-binding subunit A n=1 Tax=Striga asiatica TaxID=4170 RepID=A0A5A7QAS0_STRAF|nr:replication protein A 70 kDa DNA-binding subunit A [Striga asiatica]